MSDFLLTEDLHEIEHTKRIERIERNLMETILRIPDNNKCGNLKECDTEYPSD